MAAERQGTLTGAALGLVGAGVGLATAFGVHISAQEHDAILTFCGAVAVAAPVVGALFDHSKTQAASRVEAASASAAYSASPDKLAHIGQIQARIDELEAQKAALSA